MTLLHTKTKVLALAALMAASAGAQENAARIVAWKGPGGDVQASPDYEVTVAAGGQNTRLFTYYSYNRPVDKFIDSEGKYIKLGFLNMHSVEPPEPFENADTYAHSWTSFDFSGGPVEVTVRMVKPLVGITLPLEGCAVMPSTHGIKCRVVGEDRMSFTIAKPAKVAVLANPRLAAQKLDKLERKSAQEGYCNPLFLFARAPESGVPDKSAPGTLVVKPGDALQQSDFTKATLIWFEPGVHDYSRIAGDPDYYLKLRKGQTVYLAGGAYLYANVSSGLKAPIGDMPVLRGRGTLSGAKQLWNGIPYRTTVVLGVGMEGIQVADPQNHLTHTNGTLRDIAVVGAWHGNTDGPTLSVPKSDSYKGLNIEDCFVMAADTNLKVELGTKVRSYTVWQLANAEPAWIRGADGVVIEDLHVIAYSPWGRGQVFNLRVADKLQRNATVRNATVESPYAWLLFFMPSDSKGTEVAFDNVAFENVTVNARLGTKSVIGAATGDPKRYGKVTFRNLVINGSRVTAENYMDYFELGAGIALGREVVIE
jgi:hypothetical protein